MAVENRTIWSCSPETQDAAPLLRPELAQRRIHPLQCSCELGRIVGGWIVQLLEQSVYRSPHVSICIGSIFCVRNVQRVESHGGLFGTALSLIGDIVGIGGDC